MIVKPPTKFPYEMKETDYQQYRKPWIFLAGTIEMGKSEDWQTNFINELGDRYNYFNPRRDEWDETWKQEFENANFNYQVNWELDMISAAGIVLFNMLPDSKSPITLMELGYVAGRLRELEQHKKQKVYVCCPKGFWRKGNVDIICYRSRIPVFEKIEDIIKILK